MSWAAEFIVDDSGQWRGNKVRFATKHEAELYSSDKALRWAAVLDQRIVSSEEPVNFRWADERLEKLVA